MLGALLALPHPRLRQHGTVQVLGICGFQRLECDLHLLLIVLGLRNPCK